MACSLSRLLVVVSAKPNYLASTAHGSDPPGAAVGHALRPVSLIRILLLKKSCNLPQDSVKGNVDSQGKRFKLLCKEGNFTTEYSMGMVVEECQDDCQVVFASSGSCI